MWWETVAGQAAAFRRGELSAVDMIERHIERIADINPQVNAVTQLLSERARDEAAELDQRRGRGEEVGRLAGVPFTVKENIDIAGVATTHGAQQLRYNIADVDAPPVERLRAAGAIPIGRSNMPTLALSGMHTRSELFGDTVNPWDPGRTPGGSSGGDAVAVATGMAALGLGNDSGGSLRVPAAFCGVNALKPSYGRFPSDHRIGETDPSLGAQLFAVDGPLTRGVDDLRLLAEVLSGPHSRDPRALPVPLHPPWSTSAVKVAVVADPGGQGVHPVVRAAIQRAADALDNAGYDVREVADVPDLGEVLTVYASMLMTEFAPAWPMVRTLLGEGGHRYIEMSMDKAEVLDLPGYLALPGRLLAVKRTWAAFLRRYPLLLAPVCTTPPPIPGIESRDAAGHEAIGTALRLCSATSALGLPAVATPAGTDAGLPIGVQLIASAYREDLCLDAAEEIEKHFGQARTIDPVNPSR